MRGGAMLCSPRGRQIFFIHPQSSYSGVAQEWAMPVVMTVEELERFLAAEFPQAFHRDSGLAIESVWDGGCRVRQAFRGASIRPGGTISGPTMMALADFTWRQSGRFRWP
jgi:hypothetical protein